MSEHAVALAKKASNGDAEAFGRLYELYAAELYRFAVYYLSSKALAQDAVQEAMLGAFKGIACLKKPESIKAWMFTILSSTCKRLLRDAYAPLSDTDISDLPDNISDGSNLPCSSEIAAALSKLGEEERSVVLLSVVGGYKSKEIARMLGCAPGTVRSKLSRSLEKLRSELE